MAPEPKDLSNRNWQRPFLHKVQYDTTKESDITFSEIMSDNKLSDQSLRNKNFNFEYLEFLKQKYSKNQAQKTHLHNIQKRKFCASPSSQQMAARFAAQQQQIMAKEDEINPTSFGGMMVILIGAAIFYWLYNVDNTKHSGISSFLSRFSAGLSLEDFIDKYSKRPLHRIPDDWTAFAVIVDHIKNVFVGYNSEWIWSKLFRLFYIPSPKLLPPTKANVYTLVIDLDTVCHSEWSRQQGFERTMRPYYKEFIARMFASGWEIVIFGQCEDYDWMESPDFVKLDGKGFVQNYLWNKDCYYFNGHRCKDLQRLGRDLKHVIAIDSDPRSLQMQPENGIILKKWDPNTQKDDNSLLQLIEFLEYGQM